MNARSRPRRGRGFVVAMVVGALAIAGCSSDSKSDSTTATTAKSATTAGGAATTAAGASGASTPAGAKGAPIKVMTETAIDTNLTPYENIRDASKYYAQWVNEQGGLVDGNGVSHELQVTFCDDKYDPNEAANCARKAVDDKLIANIGGFTIDASRYPGIAMAPLPCPPAGNATGVRGVTSASMPTAYPPCAHLQRHRRRHLSAASVSSSCVRYRSAFRSPSRTRPRLLGPGSTRPKTSRGSTH